MKTILISILLLMHFETHAVETLVFDYRTDHWCLGETEAQSSPDGKLYYNCFPPAVPIVTGTEFEYRDYRQKYMNEAFYSSSFGPDKQGLRSFFVEDSDDGVGLDSYKGIDPTFSEYLRYDYKSKFVSTVE